MVFCLKVLNGMDLNKTFLNHPINVTNLRNWIHNRPPCINKNDISTIPDQKQCRENFIWHCLDCDLLLMTDYDAREHLAGKKHQNMLKNKPVDKTYPDSKNNIPEPFSALKNSLFMSRRHHKSCKSRYQLFQNDSESKNKLNEIIPLPAGRDNILETVIKGEKRSMSLSDLSIYRTPTGKYYCQLCDLTVNSQAQFLQHSESRKHKHKASRALKSK